MPNLKSLFWLCDDKDGSVDKETSKTWLQHRYEKGLRQKNCKQPDTGKTMCKKGKGK